VKTDRAKILCVADMICKKVSVALGFGRRSANTLLRTAKPVFLNVSISILVGSGNLVADDGRIGRQYTSDVDFSPSHPTAITDNELTVLANWLDSGAYALPVV